MTSFFTPLDKFAPFSPSEIDKEEKAGIDAVKVSLPFGALSNIEAILAPTRDFDDHRVGARVRTNIGEWDLSALGGYFAGDYSAGGAFAVPVSGALVKGELLVERGTRGRWEYESDGSCLPCRVFHEDRETYARGVLAGEYGFEWQNLTVSAEYYYDGSGETDDEQYDWMGLQTGRRITLARQYIAGNGSVLITPLLTASATTLVNLVDHSYMVGPALEYSVTEDITLHAGAQIYRGHGSGSVSTDVLGPSEYGTLPDRYYGILAWYF